MIPKLYHAVILLNLLHSLNIVDYTQNKKYYYATTSLGNQNHGNQSNWSFVLLSLSDQQGIPSKEYLLPDKYHATTTEQVLENQSILLKPQKMTFNQSYLEDLLTYTSQYLAIIPESIITGNFSTTLLIFTTTNPTTTKIPQIFSLILSFLYSIIFYYFTKQVYNSWYSSSWSGLKSVKTWFYLVWLFMVLYHDTMGSATYLAHAYSNLSYDWNNISLNWIDKNSNSIWISFQDVPSLSTYDTLFCLSILLNLILIASLCYKSYHRIPSIRVTQNGSIPKLTVTNSVPINQNILLNREHHQQPILINHQSNGIIIHHENEDQLDGSLVDHNQNETESTISSTLTCSSFVCDRLLVSHTNRFQSFQDRLRASSSSYLSTLESVSDSGGDQDDGDGKENLLEQEEIDDCELTIEKEIVN